MTLLKFRKQIVRDLVLVAEDMAVNGEGIQTTRKTKPNIIPILASGDKLQ
jgi:hypothetical protein